MKVLLLADIHGNWPALRAVEETFDLCICLGDLVDYGPDPVSCIEWVREHCRHVVRGNHDHAVAQGVTASGDSGFRYLSAATRPLVWDVLSPDQRRFLASLPLTQYVRIDGKVLFLVHATPRDPLDEYLYPDDAAWRRRVEGIGADIVCVGHSHHQFQLQCGGTTVLNPGSVGQPRDGDPRAAYAVIEDGKIELRRTEYPIEETVQMMNRLPLPERAKSLSASVWRSGCWRVERSSDPQETPKVGVEG